MKTKKLKSSGEMSREIVLERLINVFRVQGYDNATLNIISKDTDLQRSSLYYYFPGGKKQMAKDVLHVLEEQLDSALGEILSASQNARQKTLGYTNLLDDYFQQGNLGCIIFSLSQSNQLASFREEMVQLLNTWQTATEQLAKAAGQSEAQAQRTARQIIYLVEGSLLISKVSDNREAFAEVIQQIPELICGEADSD